MTPGLLIEGKECDYLSLPSAPKRSIKDTPQPLLWGLCLIIIFLLWVKKNIIPPEPSVLASQVGRHSC